MDMSAHFFDKAVLKAYDVICLRRAGLDLALPCTYSDSMRYYICSMLESVRHIQMTSDCRFQNVVLTTCKYTEEMVELGNIITHMLSLRPLMFDIDPAKLARLFLLIHRIELNRVEINERADRIINDPDFDKLLKNC